MRLGEIFCFVRESTYTACPLSSMIIYTYRILKCLPTYYIII